MDTFDRVRRDAVVRVGGVNVGDFVRKPWWDIWFQVISVYTSMPEHMCCTVSSRHNRCRQDSVYFSSITQIHRKDDPWDLGELRYLDCEEGSFGGENEPPVPYKYLYQGPVRITAWAYKYRKYAYPVGRDGSQVGHFQNPIRNAQFAALKVADFAAQAKVPFEGLALEEAHRIGKILRDVRNADGWWLCPSYEAMETYGKTINLRDHEDWEAEKAKDKARAAV